MQHSTRMRRVISSSMACVAVPYFPHYRIKGKIFAKICVWIRPATFVYNVCLHVKNPLFPSVVNGTYFIEKISENTKISNPPPQKKTLQREPSCSVRTDGQTDMARLIVAFVILRARLKGEKCFPHTQKFQRHRAPIFKPWHLGSFRLL